MPPFLYLLLFLSPPIPYRQLSWSDFKGKPTNDHIASSCTGIVIEKDTAYAIFEPDRSWTRTGDSATLRHEQGHFLITRIFAEKINQWRPYNPVDFEYNKGIIYWLDKWDAMESRYDLETDHGRNEAEQKRWENLIKL